MTKNLTYSKRITLTKLSFVASWVAFQSMKNINNNLYKICSNHTTVTFNSLLTPISWAWKITKEIKWRYLITTMRFSSKKFKICWLKIRLNLMTFFSLLWESVNPLTSTILIKISIKWNKYHLQVISFSTHKNLRLLEIHTESKCLNKPDKIKWNNKNNKTNRILPVPHLVWQKVSLLVLVQLITDLFIFVLHFSYFFNKILLNERYVLL